MKYTIIGDECAGMHATSKLKRTEQTVAVHAYVCKGITLQGGTDRDMCFIVQT
jgi:hypothetical protein